MTKAITEQAILLGQRQSLVGILCAPAPPAHDLAIIVLNTGIIHRVGPNRMFVSMARALAGAGHLVLRFDFSGIGDSAPRAQALPPLESCLADIREACNWLETHRHVRRFVLIGLCSGADHAVFYGAVDPRVAALAIIDPTIPATLRHHLNFFGRRLVRLRSWANVLTLQSLTVRRWMWQAAQSLRAHPTLRRMASQQSVLRAGLEGSYRQAVERAVQILALFSDEPFRQSDRRQMLDAFPSVSFGARLTIECLPGSDHLFSRELHRAALNRRIHDWIRSLQTAPNPGHAEHPAHAVPGLV